MVRNLGKPWRTTDRVCIDHTTTLDNLSHTTLISKLKENDPEKTEYNSEKRMYN